MVDGLFGVNGERALVPANQERREDNRGIATVTILHRHTAGNSVKDRKRYRDRSAKPTAHRVRLYV